MGRRITAIILSLVLVMGLCPFAWPSQSAWADDAAGAGDTEEYSLVIAIDPGHGGGDPGASGNGVVEAEANWDIAMACVNELRTYEGVKVVLTRGQGENPSLQNRILNAKAQGATVVVSLHCNSVEGAPSANGSEVWVPNDSPYLYEEAHVQGKGLASKILAELSGLGLKSRGVKTRDCTDGEKYPDPEGSEGEEEDEDSPMGGPCDWYGINYWARWNEMCGIIVEHAFLSNANDAAKLASGEWRAKMGVADATGIANYYGLTKASDEGGSGDEGGPGSDGGGTGEGGSSEGSGDAGGSGTGGTEPPDATTGEGLEKVGAAVTTPQAYDNNPSIMGVSKTTPANMAAWYTSKKKTFPADTYTQYGAATILEFCQILFEEAAVEGVRAEVVFAQSMNETGWLRFGGQVKAEQCNFCGLGATDGGAGGADFSSYGEDAVRMGLRAQVQHLKAYASTEPLKNECIDPRFRYVSRGCAPKVKDLSGRWASNPSYGDNLTNLINDLLDSSGAAGDDTPVKVSLEDVPAGLISGSSTTVYVNGVAKTMSIENGYGTVEVSDASVQSIVMYEHNTTDMSDPHLVYPTRMYTWLATLEDGVYTVKRHYGFDDLLRYAGSSIRITGNKGIRMITGMSDELKEALTDEGVLGYTVVETGTLIAFADRVSDGSLTFSTPGVSRGKAYVTGAQDPVFSVSNDVEYYTNVLVGFSTVEQYKRDLAMRPYAIMLDASGNQLVVYGGTVYRSIVYIAQQNANEFAEGTAAYQFVHGIIDACEE